MKSVHTKGAPTAPSKIVFVLRPGAVPMTVKRKAHLVVCGNILQQVSDTATQNLDVMTMRLGLSRGFAHGYRTGTVDVKTACPPSARKPSGCNVGQTSVPAQARRQRQRPRQSCLVPCHKGSEGRARAACRTILAARAGMRERQSGHGRAFGLVAQPEQHEILIMHHRRESCWVAKAPPNFPGTVAVSCDASHGIPPDARRWPSVHAVHPVAGPSTNTKVNANVCVRPSTFYIPTPSYSTSAVMGEGPSPPPFTSALTSACLGIVRVRIRLRRIKRVCMFVLPHFVYLHLGNLRSRIPVTRRGARIPLRPLPFSTTRGAM